MRKILTGTALALMFAVTPALADSSSTSASGETIPSATTEDKAVSEPALKAGDNNATVVDEGTKASGASSMTTTNAEGEPMSTTGKDAGMADGSTLEKGKPATTAGGEVVPAPDGDPVSDDKS
jgi:hypothetical protein